MSSANQIDLLGKLGTSTWLDDLSRDRISSGNLAEVIEQKSVVGVTTNPAIFASAMTTGTAYAGQLKDLKAAGATADEAVYAMAIDDVRAACDVFAPIFERTGGEDGRVSIEVDPRISDDAEATVAQARELWEKVNRPNVMIKIPATEGSLPAIPRVLAEGISVNVTLIFSVARYREVMKAYAEGIRQAAAAGHDVSTIFSVASLFVSRVDTEVDRRLEEIGTPNALALRGRAGIANARLAYAEFQRAFAPGPDHLDVPDTAHPQRPLWASTGVKNKDYSPTMYVAGLAGPDTVNTMPEATLDAVLASTDIQGNTLAGTEETARDTFRALEEIGIDLDDVFDVLEREGVEKFVDSWNDLLKAIQPQLA